MKNLEARKYCNFLKAQNRKQSIMNLIMLSPFSGGHIEKDNVQLKECKNLCIMAQTKREYLAD